MASCLVYIGRFLFFVLAGLQAYSLALYLAKYKQKDGFYGLVALYASAIVLRLYIMFDYKKLQLLLAVWTCYIVGFVIFVEIIFGGDEPIKDNFDKAKFFGPNILKTTLCRSLVIISLLSSTGRDCIVYRDLIRQLSLRMTLDLFDGVEKLSHKSEKGEYIQKLHTNVSTFITSPLHLIFLTLLHVLLGLKSYAHMSDFKIKEVCGTRHEFRHHFITSILKWQNLGLQIQDILVCKNAFLIHHILLLVAALFCMSCFLKCLNLCWLASFASYPTRYENQNNWYTFLLSTSHP
ncbi:unnamed protein product [Pocillopora meandrina]|uniref:Uncharacterized protein n=1 Tax=Pocillopora meandrina TaxID=46732 RepID=A0AAU9WIC5_9CNID|nr:unnamed protein product [Pocillopora meandrina]